MFGVPAWHQREMEQGRVDKGKAQEVGGEGAHSATTVSVVSSMSAKVKAHCKRWLIILYFSLIIFKKSCRGRQRALRQLGEMLD